MAEAKKLETNFSKTFAWLLDTNIISRQAVRKNIVFTQKKGYAAYTAKRPIDFTGFRPQRAALSDVFLLCLMRPIRATM